MKLKVLILGLFVFSTILSHAVDEKTSEPVKPCDAYLKVGAATSEMKQKALAERDAFINYFNTVRGVILERDYVIELAELALIAEEHMILVGPPGNAKSDIATTILKNITEQSTGIHSFFKIQMTPETTMSETHGPLDFNKLTSTSKYERIYEEGMLMSRTVFIDEIFDARMNAIRNTLTAINERSHGQGPREVKGNIETVFAASNKYIGEVYEKAGDDGPRAVIDRYAFVAFIPGDFEMIGSAVTLIQNSKIPRKPMPKLTYEQVDQIRALVAGVEIPDYVAQFLAVLRYRYKEEIEAQEQGSLKSYKEKLKNGEEVSPPFRATKYLSPRSLVKAAGILKAIVVREWLYSGGKRPLQAGLEDIAKLENFFQLNGPVPHFVESELSRTTNPYERAQLSTIIQEREVYRKHYALLLNEVNASIYQMALTEDQVKMRSKLTDSEKDAVVIDFTQKLLAVRADMQISDSRQSEFDINNIAKLQVAQFYEDSLREILGAEYENSVQKAIDEIAKRKQEAIEAEQRQIAEEKKQQEELIRQEQLKTAREEALKKVAIAQETTLVDNFTLLAPGIASAKHAKLLKHIQINPNARDAGDTYRLTKNVFLSADGKALNVLYYDNEKDNFQLDTYSTGGDKVFSFDKSSTLPSQLHNGDYEPYALQDDDKIMFIVRNRNLYTLNKKTNEVRGFPIALESAAYAFIPEDELIVTYEPSTRKLIWHHPHSANVVKQQDVQVVSNFVNIDIAKTNFSAGTDFSQLTPDKKYMVFTLEHKRLIGRVELATGNIIIHENRSQSHDSQLAGMNEDGSVLHLTHLFGNSQVQIHIFDMKNGDLILGHTLEDSLTESRSTAITLPNQSFAAHISQSKQTVELYNMQTSQMLTTIPTLDATEAKYLQLMPNGTYVVWYVDADRRLNAKWFKLGKSNP